MIIYNPHSETVRITFRSTEYSVGPSEKVEVPDEVGRFWVGTHGFLSVVIASTDKAVVTETPIEDEVATEEVVDVPEVVVEEVIEEEAPAAPKKKAAKKTK